MALQKCVDNKRLTEPLLNEVWQNNKCYVSEFDNESWKKMAKQLYPRV